MRGIYKRAGLALAAGALVVGLAGCATESAPVSDPSKGDNTQLAYTGANTADEQSFDTVTFGSYQGQDITWLKLAEENGKTLLISESVLDAQPYDDTAEPYQWSVQSPRPQKDVEWATSSIRTWLNGEFLNAAFSAEEQGAIAATTLSDTKNKELLTRSEGLVALRDAYVFEFLDVKEPYKEKDLRKSIVANLRDFILEFGQDFTFVGEEYRIQVGNTDFFIDLLFYNRALSCLVAIELKVGKFRPEHLGQLNFYLEALDRDVRKPNENPSVGLILCTSKDDTVVEYALSRSMSPTMVADYTLHLPDKTLLENRLRELTQALTLESGDAE